MLTICYHPPRRITQGVFCGLSYFHNNSISENVVRFYSPPICEPTFVLYVEKVGGGESLLGVLESLLECQVDILSTWCLSIEVNILFGGENRHLKHATNKWCDHAKAHKPARLGVECLKSFIQSYPSRKLVVYAMEGSIATNDLMVAGRVVVVPDYCKGSIMFEILAIDSIQKHGIWLKTVNIALKKLRIPSRIPFTGASCSAQHDSGPLDIQAEGLAIQQDAAEIAVDAAEAAATPITDHSKELLMIHEKLQALGLLTSASELLKEAQLTPSHSLAAPSSLANETSCSVSSSVQSSSCGFLAIENPKQEELSRPLVISSSVQSKMPSYFQENISPSRSRAKNFLKHKLSESRDVGESHPRKRPNTSEQGFRSPTYNKEYAIEENDPEFFTALPADLKAEVLAQQQQQAQGLQHNEEAKMSASAAEQEENEEETKAPEDQYEKKAF